MKLLSTLPTVTEDIQKICHTVHMSLNFINPSPKATEKVTHNLFMVSLSVVNMPLSAQCPSTIMVDPTPLTAYNGFQRLALNLCAQIWNAIVLLMERRQ